MQRHNLFSSCLLDSSQIVFSGVPEFLEKLPTKITLDWSIVHNIKLWIAYIIPYVSCI